MSGAVSPPSPPSGARSSTPTPWAPKKSRIGLVIVLALVLVVIIAAAFEAGNHTTLTPPSYGGPSPGGGTLGNPVQVSQVTWKFSGCWVSEGGPYPTGKTAPGGTYGANSIVAESTVLYYNGGLSGYSDCDARNLTVLSPGWAMVSNNTIVLVGQTYGAQENQTLYANLSAPAAYIGVLSIYVGS